MSNDTKRHGHSSLSTHSRVLAAVGWLLTLMVTGQAMAESPGVREEAAWYEGQLVIRLAKLNDPATIDSPVNVPVGVPNPLYIVMSAGPVRQEHPVIGVVPGDAGYTSWWEQVLVIDVSGIFGIGRNVADDPYTSTAEIEAALCEIKGDFSVWYTCYAMGKPLVDISGLFLPPNLGPLNAQIINAPPTLRRCYSN